MSEFVNVSRHAIDVPGGALVAPLGRVELEPELAEPLVRAGLLQDVTPAKPAPKKKGTSA